MGTSVDIKFWMLIFLLIGVWNNYVTKGEVELNSDKGWAVKRKKLELKAHKMGPHKRNPVFRGLRLNNTATDQPAHPSSLISAFVICFFENIMCKLANDFPPLDFFDEPKEGTPLQERFTKTFLCRASSHPPPEFRWLKDGVFISNFSSTLYSIRIENIQRNDSGVYRCIARNEFGSILSSGAKLEVAYMDEFEHKGQTVQEVTYQGDAHVIPLPHISSFPFPTIAWYENFAVAPMGEELFRSHVTLNKSLVLLDRGIQDSRKTYQPEALNGFTFDQAEKGPVINVTVLGGDRSTPAIVIPPVDKIVIRDKDVQAAFECVVNGSPLTGLQIIWYKVESQGPIPIIPSQDKYLISFTNRTLTIKTPEPSDAGEYQCEAQLNGAGNSIRARASLTVYVRPTFSTLWTSDYNQDFGDTISMPCQGQGIPTPTIQWYYNAQELSSSNDPRYTIHSNGNLTISQLDLDHAGVYQCFIRNEAGETWLSTWLRVNSAPPEFIRRPADITVIEGDEAKFQCLTQGAPKPVVVWSKDTGSRYEEIVPGGRILLINGHELLITTTESTDSGMYRCNASNSQGFVSDFARLTVFVQTQIIRPPQNLTVIKSTVAVFTCGVSHDPNIVVTWTWSYQAMNQDQKQVIVPDGYKKIIESDGTLKINQINNNDIGNYTCDVISTGGNDSRTVTLKVIDLPHPPVITNVILHPTDVLAVIVYWTPEFDGNTPIIRYSIEYMETGIGLTAGMDWVSTDLDIGADERSRSVSGLKPTRQYQFRIYAANKVGDSRPSVAKPDVPIEIPQQPPSSPPTGFYGIPFSNTSIFLYWRPPDQDTWNGLLLGYTILYRVFGPSNSTFNVINITGVIGLNPSYELGGLEYFEEYEVKVAAFNAKGTGAFSNSIRVITLEGRPTAPPENLQVTAFNSTTLEVTWEPPNQQFINGISLGYKVEGKRVGVVQTEFVAIVSQDPANHTGPQRTFLYGLLKYTEYIITVRCFTSQGDGPKTVPVIMRTQEDVPGVVGSIMFDMGDTWLKVNWTEPNEINGVLLGYTLTYMKTNIPDVKETRNLSPSTLSYTISDIQATTKYTISVFAFTGKGPGPSISADIESGVPPELPAAPFDLGVSNIETHSVLLQFWPGFDGKTSITNWIVEAQEGDDTTYKEIFQKSDPTASSIHVETLRPYTRYRLRLIAVNIVGRSEPSSPTREFKTLQAAPFVPPGNVTVRAVNATALRVSWMPLASHEWNGEPRGYTVHLRMIGVTDFTSITLNGTNMASAILDGLHEWVDYQVRMIAFNDIGGSPFSPVIVERTKESVPSAGPDHVTADVLSSSSINVSWTGVPTSDRNGMILGYKVQYGSREESISPRLHVVAGNTTMSVILQNLRKYVQYELQVLAYTRIGDGCLSIPEVVVKTDGDVPGPPASVWFPEVSYTLAKITWEPPKEPNGIIIGYMVFYKRHESGGPLLNSSVLDHETTTYTVENLDREAYYEFGVTAKTQLGWGEMVVIEVFTIANRSPPDSPSKSYVSSSLINARNVTIRWIQAPFNGYGPVRNFTVQYKLESNMWTNIPEAIMPDVTSYTVKRLRPNSRYVFRVASTNDIGTSPFSVQSDSVLTLEDKPESAPRLINVQPVTRRSVKVSWQPPLPSTWNCVLQGYIIKYRQTEHASYQEEIVTNYKEETVLDQLIKYKNYEFLVQAFNSIGLGPSSTPVTVYVGEAAPMAPPLNIIAETIKPTELMVTWDPPSPETQNGDLSGFKVYYWLATSSESTAKQQITREQSVHLTDLVVYTDYALVVQSFNLFGDGPKSDVVYQKTGEGLPGRPAEISFWNVTYDSLDVTWSPPLQPNGRIISYELTYTEESPNGGTKLVRFPNITATHLSINNLLEGINSYVFGVKARNSAGQGDDTTKRITTGPQPGSPGKPQTPELEVNQYGHALRLVWNEGYPGEYPVYGFIIELNFKESQEWQEIQQTTDSQTTADFSFLNLPPDSEYQFRVAALNIIGISEYSDASEFYKSPAPGRPTSPFSLGVSNIQARSVLLQFIQGSDGNSPITRWIVEALERDHATDYKEIYNSSDTSTMSIQVENLSPYTTYQLRLIAVNAVGRSAPSSPTGGFKTLQAVPEVAPRNVTIIALNATAITISWLPLSNVEWNGEPRGYGVLYKVTSDDKFIATTPEDSLTIHKTHLLGLQEGLQYEVKMVAFNDVGEGPFSPLIMVKLDRPRIPFSLFISNVQARSTLLQFIQGSDGINPVTHWIVEALEGENATDYKEIHNTSDTRTMSIQVYNLSPYTTYQLRLIAENVVGRSAPSSPTRGFVTLKAVPEVAPRNVTAIASNATAFTISWLPLSNRKWNGEPMGFKVFYKKISDANFTTIIPKYSLTVHRSHIVGLQEGLDYQVKMLAFNDVGESPFSAIITTKLERPTAPFGLAITNIQARSALLQFIQGSDGSSPITHWIVEALEGENAAVYKEIYNSSDTSTMSIEVESLSPYTTYQLRLIAQNVVGRSAPSSPSRGFTTLKTVPEVAPRNVTVVALNATAFKISWSPLSDLEWNGEPWGYKLFYKKTSDANFTSIIPHDSLIVHRSNIAGLHEDLQYHVKMLAFNDVGEGPFCPIITTKTYKLDTSDAASQNNLMIGAIVRCMIAMIITRTIFTTV